MRNIWNKNKKIIILYALIFIFFLVLYYCFPLTGDDYGKGDCGISCAFRISLDAWKILNGRFLGNYLVVLLKSSLIFRIVFSSLVLTITIYLVASYVNKKRINNTLLVLFLILNMPLSMFNQTISWMSGFANFAVPPVAIMIIVTLSKKCFYKKNVIFKKYAYVLAALSGLLMNLFAEHTSIFSILLGIWLIIIIYLCHHKIYKIHLVFLLFSIIGCLLMFLSPVYLNSMPRLEEAGIFNTLNLFQKIFYNFAHSSWLKNVFCDNYMLNIVVGLIIISTIKQNNCMYYKVIVLLLFCLLVIVSPIASIWSALGYNISSLFYLFIFLLYILAMIVYLVFSFYQKKRFVFYELLFLFLSQYLLVIPLLFAYGFGPRCFYASYIINLLLMLVLLENLVRKSFKRINILLYIGVLIVMFGILYMVISNKKTTIMRENIVASSLKSKKKIIYLPTYKYSFLIHQTGSNFNDYHTITFKEYYSIPSETVIYWVAVID